MYKPYPPPQSSILKNKNHNPNHRGRKGNDPHPLPFSFSFSQIRRRDIPTHPPPSRNISSLNNGRVRKHPWTVERTPETTCARRVLIGQRYRAGGGGYPHEIELLCLKNGVRIDPARSPPPGGEGGGGISLVKCTESISNITEPNISAAIY